MHITASWDTRRIAPKPWFSLGIDGNAPGLPKVDDSLAAAIKADIEAGKPAAITTVKIVVERDAGGKLE